MHILGDHGAEAPAGVGFSLLLGRCRLLIRSRSLANTIVRPVTPDSFRATPQLEQYQ
jgi:hypothetical protein